MKYKVGDSAIVKKNLKKNKRYGDGVLFVDTMLSFRGKKVTICEVEGDRYRIKGDGYYWVDEMFEPVITNWDKVKEEMTLEDMEHNGACTTILRIRKEKSCYDRRCGECIGWLKQPYKEPEPRILDEAEKKYLSAVIRPFRDRVENVRKYGSGGLEFIAIKMKSLKKFGEQTNLPYFKENTMYKGMELNKQYTLDELEI